MTNKEIIYNKKSSAAVAEIANVKKSNMQKMHNVVSSKMETTTSRQAFVSKIIIINWSVQKVHRPIVSILETVQKRKIHQQNS